MAGIIEEAGLLDDVPAVHAHCDLAFPDTLQVVHDVAERLDMELEVVEPEVDEHVARICDAFGSPMPQPSVEGYDTWSLLEAVPSSVNIMDAMGHVMRAVAAGNMMVSYMYDHDFGGSFVGLRGEESRARHAYQQFRGATHQNAKDGTIQVCPLLDWTGADVMAYLLDRGLPVHPYYRRAWESGLAGSGDPTRVRVDLALMPDTIARHGVLALVRKTYPQMWRRLSSIRPELRQFV